MLTSLGGDGLLDDRAVTMLYTLTEQSDLADRQDCGESLRRPAENLDGQAVEGRLSKVDLGPAPARLSRP
ncbi:MAG: hypothetical protein A3J75_05955 [Acidobacteria bacterium RBG_16_68_9]|nr:MAG: hypothetical protein A3J75_05955 [Acidobacteria bacterium RBG_16_68_9]